MFSLKIYLILLPLLGQSYSRGLIVLWVPPKFAKFDDGHCFCIISDWLHSEPILLILKFSTLQYIWFLSLGFS